MKPNYTSLIASIFVITIIVLSSPYFIPQANALPSVNLASMSGCGSSVSQPVYDSANNVYWQVCYTSGVLWKQDFSTNPATLTSYATNSLMSGANPIGLCQDSSSLYATGRVSREVFKIPKADPTSISVLLASGTLTEDVVYPTCLSGFVYVPYGNGVAKIATSSGATTLITTGAQMWACDNDTTLVFCTAINSGQLYEINPSTNTATLRVSGLSSPAGLEVTGSDVYVAQDATEGSVVRISRSTWTVAATGTVSSGTGDKPYGVMLVGGYLAVTTEGIGATTGNRNVYIYNPTTMLTLLVILSPVVEGGQVRPLFLQATNGVNIVAAFQGSSGSAEISNWQASVPTSTTTTTVTISVTSETSSTSTSSVTGFGGLASYTPQVVPLIHIDSVGMAGQHNIYQTQNGSVTISGFLAFDTGASGDFDCLTTDSSGACVELHAPNPSRGTFGSFGYQFPPTIDGPQPTCSIIPYLWFCKTVASPIEIIQVSRTFYGIFCNNENIVSKVANCVGHGIPVNYRTFSITVSGFSSGWNVITLLATGTESHGEAFKSNVFIYNG